MPIPPKQPLKRPANKIPCSLCHQVVQELKYHYDICEPCHQDFENGEDDLPSPSEESSNEDDMDEHLTSDEDLPTEVVGWDGPDERPILRRSTPIILEKKGNLPEHGYTRN